MHTRPIRFLRRGQLVSLGNVTPTQTLLDLLRDELHCTGTKEGCGEGDCGACTVVLGELDASAGDNAIKYRAINSCIRLAQSVDGLALWTAEDLAQDPLIQAVEPQAEPSELHPVQEALVQCHGSQCGFCTPGFVMSLFGLYQNQVGQGQGVTREQAVEALSGNLCRCTGYRPIFDAAQRMGELPRQQVNEAELAQRLRAIQPDAAPAAASDAPGYLAPTTLQGLLQARAAHPQAQLVAGCTDVGLWITKQHRQFEQVLDLTRTAELRRVEHYPHHLAIGAAVTLTEAFEALVADRPQLHRFASRFAGLPVRNSGTLGGNVANGSPIGDSMPLLIALGAHVVLMRWEAGRGRQAGRIVHREFPLEQLYTGYRQNVMRPDEVLAWIKVPRPQTGELLRAYKISKRQDDDISAVCLAVRLQLQDGQVQSASIGVGGVAATPVRASATEAALRGQAWQPASVQQAAEVLRSEFSPISDMRASSAYRREVLGNLLQRLWLDSQGLSTIDLQRLDPATLDLTFQAPKVAA
ncbi:xanthine dehydrogenase small subunit [Curvibacter sp. HBC61]|uniref:Xanthine dehydrogenase small subunit n=1 Tax=Curvibacter cyanobacteriorum TaxID=3026422 RepID=A0ABT5MZZ4_9BURK|nr:xanthine dehydrogenase small subunit [Curvibacter sp. HBC61]MDD0838357.1 xanthine dehydrogenase small subunit [Curvibacter sp. HBC61]